MGTKSGMLGFECEMSIIDMCFNSWSLASGVWKGCRNFERQGLTRRNRIIETAIALQPGQAPSQISLLLNLVS